ncbi:MAG TPA: DUF1353 domain-containing protein [Nocardioides sp.]|nr:DUF1353 domain-containing protein [Nocardioides sp.]
MELPRTQPPQPAHFFDGGDDHELQNQDAPPRIVIERLDSADLDRVEQFRMLRRIGYRDHPGDASERVFLVPRRLDDFETDLASVPTIFTWLVPKTGRHLTSTILHDALVDDRELDADGNPRYYLGPHVDRPTADEILRRAMRDAGTGFVRSWLMWAAVTLGTIRAGSSSWTPATHRRYLVASGLTLAVIVALGVVATLDLLDVVAWLPWMGDRPFALELAGGLAGAVAIPLVLALTWGRFWVAGVITGIALAVLLHVTVALAGLTLLYQALEWLAARRPLAVVVAAGTVVAACVVFTALMIGTR